jgi:mannosyl-oligosaccharide glucosidase
LYNLELPLIKESSKSLNESLLWGTYRSNLYFGLRTRDPKSLLTGIMWNSIYSPRNLRHWCEQGELVRYGWIRHDGRNYGSQVLLDRGGFALSTDFLKVSGGQHGM